MRVLSNGFLVAVTLALSCNKEQEPVATPPAPPPAPAPVAPAPAAEAQSEAPAYPTRVFFGDTHLHTSYSMDAGLFGATTTPEDAYRFARGEEVTASKGSKAKLDKPLDFLVVADHSENLGFFDLLRTGNERVTKNPKGKQWYEGFKKGGQDAVNASLDLIKTYAAGKFPKELEFAPEETRSTWDKVIAAAEKYNQPGKFTAFIGYEWTSMPQSKNLHRVVIFKDGADKAKRVVPFSAMQSDDPEKLWDWLEQYEKDTGGSVLAIPHNGNLSNGQMFVLKTQTGKPFDQAYAERRMKNEPLYEATQIKGDGEAHPFLSPDDEFADYETWDVGNLDLSVPTTKQQLKGDYAREALKNGVKLGKDLGANPFKFGMIGSTDSHTGLATADESNFYGKHSGYEPSKERLSHPFIKNKAGKYDAWQMVASGYAGVWATENTREAIFDAMERKETYATTGPRMQVRFFGGWDFTDADLQGDLVKAGYERGVPMGGDLKAGPEGKAPTFLIAAAKEADGPNLDRVQVVKGWVDADGNTHEKVYDVVWSGDRKPNESGKLPPVGDTVNVAEASYENSIGAPELIKVWTDPSFDAKQGAFYYVRVLQIPTPRWTAYDVKRFGSKVGKEVKMKTQERAYTSPIWFGGR